MALRQLIGPKLVPLCSAFREGYGVLSHQPHVPMERCCHDDSNQKSAWVNTNTYHARPQDGCHKSVISSEVQIQRANIISDLNTVVSDWSSRLQERHSIHSRIETLESLGCCLDDIQAHPDILLLSEVEVIKRVQRLRRLSVEEITVRMLKSASVSSKKLLQKRLDMVEYGSMIEKRLAECLDCSIAELLELEKEHSSFDWMNSPDKILAKVQHLTSLGFTSEDIKGNMFIMRKSLKYVTDLIRGMQLILGGNPTTVDRETIELFIDSEKVVQKRPVEPDEKQCLLARLLGVEVTDIKDIRYTSVTFGTVVRKLVYLYELGIEKRDILNHFYLLRHSFKKLVDGVASAHKAGIAEMTAITLINVIQHRYIPARLGRPRQQQFLASVLGISLDEYRALGPHVGMVCAADKLTLKNNVKYLLGEGFTLDEIRDCLLVVTHDPEVLRMYLESMPEREEFQPYEEIRGDRRVVLNAVQYLIEKDANFSCSKEQMGVGMSHEQTVDS